MRRICCRCFALVLGLPLCAVGAQETPALVPGARVRVTAPKADCTYPETAPCYRKVVGQLESVDSATIVVQVTNGMTLDFPREPNTRLEVSTGPGFCGRGRRGRCIGIGLLSGAALGALAGGIASSGCGRGNVPCAAYYALAIPGALVGAIVGAVVPGGEHWKTIALPAHLSLGPAGSGRFALGLSVRF